jgi:hypothetical protein
MTEISSQDEFQPGLKFQLPGLKISPRLTGLKIVNVIDRIFQPAGVEETAFK